jgi:WD40 repeat protein
MKQYFNLFLIIAVVFASLATITPINLLAQTPKLTFKRGSDNQLNKFDISPDDKYGITSDGKEAVLWEISSGSEINRFPKVSFAGFTGNRDLMLLYENPAKIVKTDLMGNVLTQYPNPGTINSGTIWSFQPGDGVFIDNEKLYNINTGNYISRENSVSSLSIGSSFYSSSLEALLVGEMDGVLNVFDGVTGKLRQSIDFKTPDSKYDDVLWQDFSEDGSKAGLLTNSNLFVKDAQTKKTLFTLKAGSKWDIKAAAFLGNDKILVFDINSITLYSLSTSKKIWQHKHNLQVESYWSSHNRAIKISNDKSKIYLASNYQKTVQVLDAKTGDSLKSLSGVFSNQRFNLKPEYDKDLLTLVGTEAKVLRLNLKSGILQDNSNNGFFTGGGRLAYNDNKLFYSNGSNLKAYSITQKNEYRLDFEKQGKQDIFFLKASYDNKYIIRQEITSQDYIEKCKRKVLYVLDATGKQLWESNCESYYGLGVANKKNEMVLQNVTANGDWGNILIKDIATGNTLKELTRQFKQGLSDDFIFSPNDNYLLANKHELFNLQNNSSSYVIKDFGYDPSITATAFSPDEKQLALAYKGNVYAYDIENSRLNSQKLVDNQGLLNIADLKYSEKGDFLFIASTNNTIRVWDLKENKLAATMYINEAGKQYCVTTPEGRFDAKDGDFSSLYYVKGLNTIPLTATFEKFYTPSLLARILNREKFDPIPINVFDLHPQPRINMRFKDGANRNLEVGDDVKTFQSTTGVAEVTVNASAPEDAIEEIRLFHNGKLLNLATRGLFVTDDATNTQTKTYTINLLAGNNNIRAIALNTQRTESQPDEIEVLYKKANDPVNNKPVNTNAAAVADIDKNATLHLIVVGINQYQNKTMSLNYALADATAFKEEVERDAKSIITNVKTYFVTDNAADKTGISNAFKEVQQNAKPQDVFIFYYAGHGVIGKDKEFYLVPTDVSDLKNVQSELEQKGIASKLLQQYAIDIQAQKQLFILDACQSAGAFETLMSNDGNQQKTLAVVARSTGTHWMAASGAMQYANEFASLGHGVFTYVLLQALKGGAAKSKLITVNGLKEFLQTGVPELMKKYNGAAQYPASYGLGNDFPVEVIK